MQSELILICLSMQVPLMWGTDACSHVMGISDWEGVWKHLSIFSAHWQNYQYVHPQNFVMLFISLLKFILQQHHFIRLLFDFQTLLHGNYQWKHSSSLQYSFYSFLQQEYFSTSLLHTMKKTKSYYLCQSNRNKCIEGLTCLPKGMLPEIFHRSHPAASATELACLTTN